MNSSHTLLRDFSQNESLPIRLVSPGFGHVAPPTAAHYELPHRLAYYFFLFVWEGAAEFGADLEKLELAFELGFNDPAYFSRLFKKATGKTVAGFLRDMS